MSVVIDEAALYEALNGWSSPTQRYVYARAEEIREVARHHIARSDGPGPHLADSSLVERIDRGNERVYLIGFESEHVGPYYFGAAAHVIVPRNARVLAFKWPKRGPGMFFFRKVNHPGNAPHPFLNEAVMELFGTGFA